MFGMRTKRLWQVNEHCKRECLYVYSMRFARKRTNHYSGRACGHINVKTVENPIRWRPRRNDARYSWAPFVMNGVVRHRV